MTTIQIHWKVAYGGEAEYEVWGDGPMYRVTLRYEADEYFRRQCNGGDERWFREVVPAVGILHAHCAEMVKPEVLAVFREYILTTGHREFGTVSTGYFNHDPAVRTWVRMEEPYVYNPKASRESFDKHFHCYMDPKRGWCCDPIGT
jgi:hypothetical protein